MDKEDEMKEFLFLDKSAVPTDEDLQEVLSGTYKYWRSILDEVSATHGEIIPEWKFYDKKSGWTLKNMVKKRNIFFFKPYKGFFELTFVFGEKAVSMIETGTISKSIITAIHSAKKYAEGRGVTVRVRMKGDLRDIFKLIDIKIRN